MKVVGVDSIFMFDANIFQLAVISSSVRALVENASLDGLNIQAAPSNIDAVVRRVNLAYPIMRNRPGDPISLRHIHWGINWPAPVATWIKGI